MRTCGGGPGRVLSANAKKSRRALPNSNVQQRNRKPGESPAKSPEVGASCVCRLGCHAPRLAGWLAAPGVFMGPPAVRPWLLTDESTANGELGANLPGRFNGG